jgi:putative SOS response-associated peptidase YedK
MCGRFRLSKTDKEVMKQFGVEIDPDYSPRYNISPSQQVRVMKLADDSGAARSATVAMQMHIQRWGLVPHWAKDVKIGYKMINARSETILEKPSFRTAFKKRRCLIPADGFYEWKKDGDSNSKAKQPFHFGMKDDSLFAFAGIWEQWKAPEGAVLETCAILTTSPNELVADVHDRMPVILPASQYALWLTAEAERVERLQELLVPYPAEEMKKYPVSSVVNSPKNDMAACAAAAG